MGFSLVCFVAQGVAEGVCVKCGVKGESIVSDKQGAMGFVDGGPLCMFELVLEDLCGDDALSLCISLVAGLFGRVKDNECDECPIIVSELYDGAPEIVAEIRGVPDHLFVVLKERLESFSGDLSHATVGRLVGGVASDFCANVIERKHFVVWEMLFGPSAFSASAGTTQEDEFTKSLLKAIPTGNGFSWGVDQSHFVSSYT
jgi:hypothetical protein